MPAKPLADGDEEPAVRLRCPSDGGADTFQGVGAEGGAVVDHRAERSGLTGGVLSGLDDEVTRDERAPLDPLADHEDTAARTNERCGRQQLAASADLSLLFLEPIPNAGKSR